ncbi:iron-sulfur flavoprotein, putative [Entamoeba nuttalli P19]|uniref:Iron-sulfur flavoprotein, putative n=1 Tax=Entamoeba nuttalli (strain P19) TaxID=1076696 RepID=K2H351_ENTNP|nr:iron-sulfur flavoprotein, putative [Entamoeba nuttalli P19]EKE40797.1 iron-sulfur flavoprotein, putative [Entamoeba nuttalli P19]|eukprot:XP_008856866.1 iron-sulfur flavoprotein, putative [Entamoeba nuttalli P19]
MTKQLKVLLINGSPRENGNTFTMLSWVKEGLEKEGINTEIYQLGRKDIKTCKSCWGCMKTGKCWQQDPVMDELLEKIIAADGIIIGSPTYYADVPGVVKTFIDRTVPLSVKSRALNRKVGAAVVMARRGGAIHVYDTINHWFGINGMITIGSTYWNDGYNPNVADQHEVEKDGEAKNTMKNLAENMAFVLKRIVE